MNAIQTDHNLDFEAAEWKRDKRVMVFRIGTCHGQYGFKKGTLMLISIINETPGNGHLNDVFQWFEFAAKTQGIDLMVCELMNTRFMQHLILKRGFVKFNKVTVIKRF